MARITVEDCLKKIDNQFDLVMIAARRARRLANGAEPLVELENDKPTVVALREIAAGLINEEILDQMAEPEEDILSSEEAEELLASTPMPGLNPASATPTGFTRAIEIATEITIQPVAAPQPVAAEPAFEAAPESVVAEPAPELAAEAPEAAVAELSDDLVADQLAALLAATPEPEAAPTEDSAPVAEPEAEPEADDSEPKPL